MFKFIFAFFFLFGASAYAQQSTQLIGKWKFTGVSNSVDLDSTKRATLQKVFADLVIHLKADQTYSAVFFKEENGTWTFDNSNGTLSLQNEKKTEAIHIIDVNDKILVLELGKGKELMLEKIQP